MSVFALLPDRAVLTVSGADRVTFLQGLVSNDVAQAAPDRALFAALLTPQGKFLYDFILADAGEALWLDGEAARLPDLRKRLSLYKLRSKVGLEEAGDGLAVVALWGEGAAERLGLPVDPGAARALEGGLACIDPRLPALGARAILPAATVRTALTGLGFAEVAADAYDAHRLALGVPDGSRDLEVEKATLLEGNYDALNAISWSKGCYMGQELTARTRYRGLLKKRLFPVTLTDGPLPEPGTPVLQDGREVGTLRSGRDGRALALLRLEAVERAEEAPLTAGPARLHPIRPDWLATEAAE